MKDLEEQIKEMFENQIAIKKPDNTVDIVEEIIKFNKQNQNQTGRGLKILTPQQIPSRLPISLAQLQAGNNSQRLKNKKRRLLYYMYGSKKLSKTIYKHLISII